jgi:hypothetical protein
LFANFPTDVKRIQVANEIFNIATRKYHEEVLEAKKIEFQQAKAEYEQAQAKAKYEQAEAIEYDDDDDDDDDELMQERMQLKFLNGYETPKPVTIAPVLVTMKEIQISVKLPAHYEAFIMALPDCPMILGFHAMTITPGADECCYCPCSTKLEKWRVKFGINEICEICDYKKKHNFTPNGLIQHLKTLKENTMNSDGLSGFCHWSAFEYLNLLYKNYYQVENVHHRALYDMLSPGYNEALRIEKAYDTK